MPAVLKGRFTRKEQNRKVAMYKARGFSVTDNTPMGITLERIDEKGFREKVAVDIYGRAKVYIPRKATTFERMKLPKQIKTKYSYLDRE